MIEYFKNYHITFEEQDIIEASLNKNVLHNFKVMEKNVCEVLAYLHEIGVRNLSNVIIFRPDIFFKTRNCLEEQFSKINIKLLISIIDNNIDDLVCFNI